MTPTGRLRSLVLGITACLPITGFADTIKIDVIKNRLIKYYGYNEASARDVLSYVASIFARGDVKE